MQSREELITKLVKQAQEKPEFRKNLLANPKKVLEAKLGVTLPESFSVKVHEETLDTLHNVLPSEN